MYGFDDIERLLGAAERQHAENKRRGGDANDEGRAFELSYAVCRIARLAAERLKANADGSDTFIEEQVCGFVDDLYVREGTQVTYSQIKDVQALHWGGRKRLAQDYQSQKALLSGLGMTGNLELVVSRAALRSSLIAARPQTLSDVTVVHHERGRLPADINQYPELISDLQTLCHPFVDASSVANAVRRLLEAWGSVHGEACLRDLIEDASEASDHMISPLDPKYPLPTDVAAILDEVEDFTYVVRGTTFAYRYAGAVGKGKGVLPYACGSERWMEFEARLRAAPPADLIDLMRLWRNR